MSLRPPLKVEKLQQVLRAKAKESPSYRFYLLYDKMYRADVLAWAFQRCRANGGVPGVDGQTFADITAYGLERWLGELAQELRDKTYRPAAVLRAWIPKGDGKQRPLGIPTIRDRVVQMAFVLVVEPILDEDLQPEQHAYRTGHSAHQAVREVQAWLDRGSKRRSRRRLSEAGSCARPATRTRGAALRKEASRRHCWRTCTCGGSCWAGKRRGMSNDWTLTS